MWAIEFRAPSDVIAALVEIGGRGLVMEKDRNGWTSLHDACHYASSLDVIKLLLDVGGKRLVMKKTNGGFTALGIASKHNLSPVVLILKGAISALASATAEFQNDVYNFNQACQNHYVSLQIVKSLIQTWGVDALFHGRDAEMLPMEQLYDSKPSGDIIRYLLSNGAVTKCEKEYHDVFPNIASDWKPILQKAVETSDKMIVALRV